MKKAALMAVVAGTCAGFSSVAMGQATIEWKIAGNGDWSSTASWTPTRTPGGADVVGLGLASPYTSFCNGNFSIAKLEVTNPLATLQINAGMTLATGSLGVTNNGRIFLAAHSGCCDSSKLLLSKNSTISGTGVVELGDAGRTFITTTSAGTDTATIGPDIVILGAGVLDGSLINQGTIAGGLSGGPTINGLVTQQGLGGILVNSPGLFASIGSGTVNGGSITTTNGGQALAVSPTSRADGVTLTSGSLLVVTPGNALNVGASGFQDHGRIYLAPHSGCCDSSKLVVANDAVLGGTGLVELGEAGRTYLTTTASGTDTATIGVGLTIIGPGFISGTFINRGTIGGGLSGGPTIDGVVTQAGAGRIQVNGAGFSASIGSGRLVGGTITTTNGARVSATSGSSQIEAVSITEGSSVVVAAGATLTIGPTGTQNNGHLFIAPHSGCCDSSTLVLSKNSLLDGKGVIELGELGRTFLTTTTGGTDSATVGPGQTLRGSGSITGTIVNKGTLAPGNAIGRIDVFGGLKQDPTTGVIEIDLKSASERDSITGTGSIKLGGTLRATLLNFYQLPRGINNAYAFITLSGGGTVTGTFAKLDPYWLRVKYEPTRVLLYADCRGDFNADGFVTGDDYDAYVIAFFNGDPSADVDNDGFITGDDFDAFSDAFTAGC